MNQQHIAGGKKNHKEEKGYSNGSSSHRSDSSPHLDTPRFPFSSRLHPFSGCRIFGAGAMGTICKLISFEPQSLEHSEQAI
jgi:hypothetical protein